MKHAYRLLALLGLCSLSMSAARAQDWRPFRPGLIYSYAWSTTNAVHTLRLDSAYQAGTDSVYTFNRVLRPQPNSPYQFRPSPNNILGARLICHPARYEYALETLAETGLTAQTLELKPRAAVGSTWAATSTLTATLTSRVQRTWGLAPNAVTDSVATITLSNGRIIELSKQHGLVRGPSNWTAGTLVDLLQGNSLPVPYQSSIYSPLAQLDFQPGDEFGYISEDVNAIPCFRHYELRRILTRQQTADSLIYTYITQKQFNRYGGLNHPCGATASQTTSAVGVGRIAVPLRRPQWNGRDFYYGHSCLRLLTFEYASLPTYSNALLMGEAITTGSGNCTLNGRQLISYSRMYLQPVANGFYTYGVDVAGGWHSYANGVGEVRNFDWYLQYYRKLLPNGTYATCGMRTNFNTLLPSREAQSLARLQLFPNPAAQEATLILPQPAAASGQLSLHDALGRQVWQQTVGRGTSTITVPLTKLPAGLYVVQLRLPGEAPLALRLQHVD